MATGDPIRSKDFARERQMAKRQYEAAEEILTSVEKRTRQATLAMQAMSHAPTERMEKSNNNTYTYTLNLQPAGGSERIGHSIAPRRTEKTLAIHEDDLTALENEGLLTPGYLWAKTSPNQTHTFEVRLHPARLVEYNELYIPHMTGTLSITLFSPQESRVFRGLTEPRLFRSNETHLFNGRMLVQSEASSATPSGQFIHTLGGLSFFRSTWTSSGMSVANLSIPRDGFLEFKEARLLPSGETVTPEFVYQGNTLAEFSGSLSDDGDPLYSSNVVQVQSEMTSPAQQIEITFSMIT